MSDSTDKKRILLIAANPSGSQSLQLPKEFREIEEGIQLAENRDLFDVKQTGATRYKDLRRQLLKFKPHIVHFSGHGSDNGILLEDDSGNIQLASRERVCNLLIKFTDHLECVIFNACNSKHTAHSLQSHIPYSIGMNAPIADKDAIDFSVGFYDAIGDGRTYSDAFDFGLNAIEDIESKIQRSFEIHGDNNDDSPIPELFTKQTIASTQDLSKKEEDFVSQIFSQRNQGVPQVILSQEGRDTVQMARQLKQHASDLFDDDHILHIYPPANPKAEPAAYFRRLGRQCKFKEACFDSMLWAEQLEDMLYDDKPLFLLITDFEKGSAESRRALAGELRQLQEMFNRQLKIIIFGGEKLAEQVFAAGDLSLLNHAITQYVPELDLHDLQINQPEPNLDEQALQLILDISGGHPLLIRHLMNQTENSDYQQALEQSSWPNRFFTRYREACDYCDKVCNWLQNQQVHDYNDWPMDKLLRDLYWNNLLMRKEGKFHWRCDVIRDMGRKVLGC